MRYWQLLQQIVLKPSSYPSLLEISLKRSVLFFIVSSLFLGAIQGVTQAAQGIPSLLSELSLLQVHLPSQLPESLAIEYQANSLKVTPNPLPLSFPEDSAVARQTYRSSLLTYFNSDLPVSSLSAQLTASSLSIITPKYVYLNVDADQWSQLELVAILGEDSWSLNKQEVIRGFTDFADTIRNNIPLLTGAIVVFNAVSLLIGLIWTTLIQSIFAYFVLRTKSTALSWQAVFQLSLYILVAVTLINTVAIALFGVSIPLIVSFGYWLYAVLIYRALSSQHRG